MPSVTNNAISRLVKSDCMASDDVTCYVIFWLWRTIPILLLVLGTSGNVLNLLVLSRRNLRKYSTVVALITLAVTDLVALWTNSIRMYLYQEYDFTYLTNTSVFMCKLFEWILKASVTLSNWLLVLITAERTLLTMWPTRARSKITRRRMGIAVGTCVSLAATFNIHLLFGFVMKDIEDGKENKTVNGTFLMIPDTKCVFVSKDYEHFYYKRWFMCLFMCSMAAPLVLIIIGNSILCVKLVKQRKLVRPIMALVQGNSSLIGQSPSPQPESNFATTSTGISNVIDVSKTASRRVTTSQLPQSEQALSTIRRSQSVTTMLVVVSAVYVVTTMPYAIEMTFFSRFIEASDEGFSQLQMVFALCHFLFTCNYSLNFYLYFISGSLFKREWRNMIGLWKHRARECLRRQELRENGSGIQLHQ